MSARGTVGAALLLGLTLLGASRAAAAPRGGAAPLSPLRLLPGRDGWRDAGLGAIRGATLGPIESSLHPDAGYGSEPYRRALSELKRMGCTWVSLTVFGRVWDLSPTGVDLSFEAPFADNRRNVLRAVEQAHAEGLRVMLVPHLWVETGGWRAEIDPGDDAAWARWARAYSAFTLAWAEVAQQAQVDLFSVGVELRSWVTTSRAPSFTELIRQVRSVYPGLLTYAANWDDVEHTVILGELDLIGINAFYPLTERAGATLPTLVEGGQRIGAQLEALARQWDKPVLFTEFGYTTRTDPALRPWEWPDGMRDVQVDERAQAEAYLGLLTPLPEREGFAGFFVWRLYADPNDSSQEAEWGFSPRGKLAELALRGAYATHWSADGPRGAAAALARPPVGPVGAYP